MTFYGLLQTQFMIPKIVIDLTSLTGKYGLGVETFAQGLTVGIIRSTQKVRFKILTSKKGEIWIQDFLDKANLSGVVEISIVDPILPFILDKILALIYRGLLPSFLWSIIENLKWMRLRVHYSKFFVIVPSTYLNVTFGKRTLVCLHDCQETAYPHFFDKRQLRYRRIKLQATLNKAWKIQVSSNFVKSELSKIRHTRFDKFIVIPEGVDTKEFIHVEKLLSDSSTLQVFVPGSFLPHKNHSVIFDAVKTLKLDIKIVFFMTGTINDRALSFRLNLSENDRNRIVFLGFISKKELIRYYHCSDVVLSASLYESSSLPLLEGYSCGCVVVASAIPAHNEMHEIIPKMYLFDPTSPYQLSEILMKLAQDKISGKPLRPVDDTTLSKIDWSSSANIYLRAILDHIN